MIQSSLNSGWSYQDVAKASVAGTLVSSFYAQRYPHSDLAVWLRRLAAGEILRNGRPLQVDAQLERGDRLLWRRPPWREPAVPDLSDPLFDDGDLLVYDKPSGLPVLPAGGFLDNTLLRQIEERVATGRLDAGAGLPRPVHRLGRCTSGLLVCARRPATRAWLSALLREGGGACRKIYRALIHTPSPQSELRTLQPGDRRRIDAPIARQRHPQLGYLWAAALPGDQHLLPASSALQLLQRRPHAWLVEVAIATGRPHQIRIHTALVGAPLLGDPLYRSGGGFCPGALPGDGGYRLHAQRLRIPRPRGGQWDLEAPLPLELRG